MTNYKPFTRSAGDRMVCGVAGGTAEYLGLDPVLVRVLFVVACFATGGAALLAYIAMAILMPVAGAEESQESAGSDAGERPSPARPQRSSSLAVILIAIGAVMLFSNVGWNLVFGFAEWGVIWAIAFIVLGLYLLSRRSRSS